MGKFFLKKNLPQLCIFKMISVSWVSFLYVGVPLVIHA